MSSSDEDFEDGPQWLLGFLQDPATPRALLRHRFKSKVGGRPAWLDPLKLPNQQQLSCPQTGSPLCFLLQVYSPPDDVAHAFHRVILLFVSPKGDALAQPGMVRALRCQLPLHNQFYSPSPDRSKLPRQVDAALCWDPWRTHQCEEAMARDQLLPDAQDVQLLQEHELVVEAEEEAADEEAALSSMLEQQRLAGDAATAGEDAEMAADMAAVEAQASPDQQHFARFAARVQRAPEQVLRYCFEDGAEPLWPSPCGAPAIPPCPLCRGPRSFEFQVMPQLLNFLGVSADDKHALDWGTIAVYSCATSCKTIEAYVEEHVVVQA